jgi:(p)ppGpp synthase/HD superfamily hydrolase
VGNKCVSALIDGEPCRLNTPIPNGSTVKINTKAEATPHSIWLNFAITAKARSSIRNWINKRKSHEFIDFGKQILDKTLARYDVSFDEIDRNNIELTLDILNLNDTDAMFSSIARGNQSARIIAKRLLNDDSLKPADDSDDDKVLLIKGTEGLAVNLQTCCYPIPNDPIIAELSETKGLEVHRSNCPILMSNASHREQFKETLSIAWVDDTTSESHFLAPLNVAVRNRVGVLSHITNLLEEMRVNIEDINISGDSDVKDMYFLLQVNNEKHLRQIAESLNNQSQVIDVSRPFAHSN